MGVPASPAGSVEPPSARSSTLEVATAELLSKGVPNGGIAAWLRVVAYAACALGTLGVQYLFGLLFVELLHDIEGRQEELALVGSGAMFILLLMAPVSGFLATRYGARRVCAAGAILAGAGLGLSATATRPWHLYLTYSVLVGFAHSLSSFAPLPLMAQWFDSRLGLAIGIANSGTALAPLLLGPVAPIIFRAIGWRRALVGLAGADATLLAVASLLLTPPSHQRGASRTSAGRALSVRTYTRLMLRTPVAMVASLLLIYGLGCWVPIVHVVKMGVERGLSKAQASGLLSSLALGNATLRIGWLVWRPFRTIRDILHDGGHVRGSRHARRLGSGAAHHLPGLSHRCRIPVRRAHRWAECAVVDAPI